MRHADGAGLALAVDRVGDRHRRGLREAVALDQAPAREALEPLGDLQRQGGRPGQAGLDAGQVVPALLDRVVDGHVHGGHAREQRRPVLVDRGQHAVEVEAGQQHQGGAKAQAEQQADGQPVHVEEGQHGHHDLAPRVGVGEPGPYLLDVGPEVGVGEHHALGDPGGAAGVLEQGQVVVGVDLDQLRGRRRRGQRVAPASHRLVLADAGAGRLALLGVRGQPPLEPGQLVQHRGDDHLADRGPRAQRLDPVIGQVEADQHLDPGVGQLVAELPLGVEGVVLDHGGPEAQRPEQRHHRLRAVGQDQPDLGAAADPEPGQHPREPPGLLVQLGVGDGAALEVEGRRMGEVPGRVLEQAGQAGLGKLHVLGDARRVVVEPRRRRLGHRGPPRFLERTRRAQAGLASSICCRSPSGQSTGASEVLGKNPLQPGEHVVPAQHHHQHDPGDHRHHPRPRPGLPLPTLPVPPPLGGVDRRPAPRHLRFPSHLRRAPARPGSGPVPGAPFATWVVPPSPSPAGARRLRGASPGARVARPPAARPPALGERAAAHGPRPEGHARLGVGALVGSPRPGGRRVGRAPGRRHVGGDGRRPVVRRWPHDPPVAAAPAWSVPQAAPAARPRCRPPAGPPTARVAAPEPAQVPVPPTPAAPPPAPARRPSGPAPAQPPVPVPGRPASSWSPAGPTRPGSRAARQTAR